MSLLLETGANPQEENDDYSLHLAASDGHADVVAILLEAGANPQKKDAFGSTALHLAVRYDHDDIVELLKSWIEDHN